MEKQRILAANLGRRNRGSNLERDKRRQRVALAIAVVVVLMVIAIPIYGWVTTFVLPPREVIVRVNDVEYDMGYLVKLMRMVQRQTEAGGQTVNLGTVPFQLVQDLATNELVVQGAQSQGLQVTPEELDAELRLRTLGPVDPASTSTPAELESEFQEIYRQFLNQVQLTDNEYREIVKRDMYRLRLEEHVGSTIPREQPHVHLYGLALQSLEDVEEARTKFERGSTFTELVEEYALDPRRCAARARSIGCHAAYWRKAWWSTSSTSSRWGNSRRVSRTLTSTPDRSSSSSTTFRSVRSPA